MSRSSQLQRRQTSSLSIMWLLCQNDNQSNESPCARCQLISCSHEISYSVPVGRPLTGNSRARLFSVRGPKAINRSRLPVRTRVHAAIAARQFARNFANNSRRIPLSLPPPPAPLAPVGNNFVSGEMRRALCVVLLLLGARKPTRNQPSVRARSPARIAPVSYNGLPRSEHTASITGQQSGAWINREANSPFVHLDLERHRRCRRRRANPR